jgi:hypothetical protein
MGEQLTARLRFFFGWVLARKGQRIDFCLFSVTLIVIAKPYLISRDDIGLALSHRDDFALIEFA